MGQDQKNKSTNNNRTDSARTEERKGHYVHDKPRKNCTNRNKNSHG